MIYNKKKYFSYSKLYVLFVMFFLFLYVFFGFKKFELWGQVTYLWDMRFNVSDTLLNPHGPRYLLVYPIFYFSEFLSIDYNLLFSYVAVFLIGAIVYINIITTLKIVTMKQWKYLLIVSVYILLALFMNGRMIFSILASNILLFLFLSETNKFVFYLFSLFSIFLASVSSGTLTIILLWFLIFWLFFYKKNKSDYILGLFFIVSFFYFSVDFIIMYMEKNINFFGGGFSGIINMLNHGVGRVFFAEDEVIFFTISMFISSIVIIYSIKSILEIKKISNDGILLLTLFFISCFGGLFGLSTATVGIPILLILILSTYEITH